MKNYKTLMKEIKDNINRERERESMFLGRKINIVKMTILPNAIYRFNAQVKSESKVAQLCPTLCDPVDYSLPGSSIHGILQARILEWVAISFSRGSSRPRD